MSSRFHIFRNYTVEPLFAGLDCSFSDLGSVGNAFPEADVYVFFYCAPIMVEASVAASEITTFAERLQIVEKSVSSGKRLIVFTLTEVHNFSWEEANRNFQRAIFEFNELAFTISNRRPSTYCLSIDGFLRTIVETEFSSIPLFDWKYFYTFQTPFNPHLSSVFSQWFLDCFEKISFSRKKLLVLDLDGTLWSGVIGEDGGLIGGTYPGNAFFDIQRMIASIKNKGVLLAVISKNNLSDVEEFFSQNSHMPLRLSDFVEVFCNWNHKAENLRMLLEKLNLGPESAVILDDSPFEREHLKAVFPSVTIPELPTEPYALVPAVAQVIRACFSAYALTDEDLNKGSHYQQKKAVEELRSALSYADFLMSLETRIQLDSLGCYNRSRFLQLMQKTNQFNLTGLRLTDSQLAQREERGEQGYVLSVEDRFGSHGIVGGILVSFGKDGQAQIESLMLSCRVLGREIEFAFMGRVVNHLYNKGIRSIAGVFNRTPKNAVVEFFFEKQGFTLVNASESTKSYILRVFDPLYVPVHITLKGHCRD